VIEHRRRPGRETRIGHPAGIALQLDMQFRAVAGKDLEHIAEERKGLATALLEHHAAMFATAQCRDRPGVVGGAIERRIVDNEQLAIDSEVHVELDALDRQCSQLAEPGQAVLRPEASAAAMPDDVNHWSLLRKKRIAK
jgi:hypothetical protein